MRLERGYSQEDIADGTGIGLRTYQRLEANQLPSPRLWYLVNCAVALECSLEDVIEDSWMRFYEQWEKYDWVGPDPRRKSARVCREDSPS